MSDWDDEEWNAKTKMAAPPPPLPSKQRASFQQQNDDWDDEPNRQRSHNSHRAESDGRQYNNNYDDSSDGQEDQVTFGVGKSSVGAIIGRQGSKIKELQEQFHVRINIGMFFHI